MLKFCYECFLLVFLGYIKRYFLGSLFLFHTIGLSAGNLPENDLAYSANRYFDIVGEETRSVHYIQQLTELISEKVLSELDESDCDLARKILVQLYPFSNSANPPNATDKVTLLPYTLTISDLGFVTASFNWQESLGLYTCIEGIVAAFIQAYGYATYGNIFLELCPSKGWYIQGIAADIYLALRPKVSSLVYEKAASLSIAKSSSYRGAFKLPSSNFDDIEDSNLLGNPTSYVWYRWIKEMPLNPNLRRTVFNKAIRGEDSLGYLWNALDLRDGWILEEEFKTFLDKKRREKQGPFMDLEISMVWLESIGDLSSLEFNSLPDIKDLNLSNLWRYRKNTEVIDLIKARMELLSLALNRINPVYFNAAQSLILTFERIIRGEAQWESLYYLSNYLEELDRANLIKETIEAKL